ncbi:hypothetical protein GCM10010271_46090 [Streptomyces kurssanovii]|nr:hypothetical protein GCM10010271_46090 [Streptomyces kurssanovii]
MRDSTSRYRNLPRNPREALPLTWAAATIVRMHLCDVRRQAAGQIPNSFSAVRKSSGRLSRTRIRAAPRPAPQAVSGGWSGSRGGASSSTQPGHQLRRPLGEEQRGYAGPLRGPFADALTGGVRD